MGIGYDMSKLSISLPNNTQITLESDEAEVVHDVLGMVLSGMPLDAMTPVVATPPAVNGHGDSVEKSTDTSAQQLETADSIPAPQDNGLAPVPRPVGASSPETPHIVPNGTSTNGTSASPPLPSGGFADEIMDVKLQPQQNREDFRSFCQSLNPMGDMRRVVVAAEGGSRFFSWDGVSADDLGDLFDLAGWRRANSFTQTLRNAARSKFGWLERIPGRSGRYAATDVGRSIIFGS